MPTWGKVCSPNRRDPQRRRWFASGAYAMFFSDSQRSLRDWVRSFRPIYNFRRVMTVINVLFSLAYFS